MPTAPQKICTLCGKDVSAIPRVKNTAGLYFCQPCAQNATTPGAKPSPIFPAPSPDDDIDITKLSDEELGLPPETPEKSAEEIKPAAPLIARVSSTPQKAAAANPTPAAPIPNDGPLCPSCDKQLQRNAKICTDCGIKIPSGRPVIMSLARDEDSLYSRAERILRAISWVIPFGWAPIASDAYATRKPYATYFFAAVTIFASLIFTYQLNTTDDPEKIAHIARFMLWPGHDADANSPTSFHWYQLVTNTFIHDPNLPFGFILHLGGNMLFFFIFGMRVNALIGNLKMAILYPFLGMLASWAHLLSTSDDGPPALGAFGAIMGLAGMYLIFFPIQRVHMSVWLKIHWRVPTILKIWAVRGFWVLIFYISFDIVATLFRSKDGVAHWAHLGGFIAGAAIALIMLILRIVQANHGDILSVILGKYAWPLIGKPNRAIHTYAQKF